MHRVKQIIFGASVFAFALTLGGCESFDMPEFFNAKKPLPGERRAVFPEGVPGAPSGVPAELIKGNQATAEATGAVPGQGAKPEPAKTEEKPKPKPIPKMVQKPAAAPKQATAEAKPANDEVWPAPPKSNAPAQATAAPWPAPPSAKPAAAWPSQ